jgi:inorganic pyrophosphatase/exopolyphosphatase
MNTNPSTFRLRNEIRWFLKENFSNVIFLNDINLNELYNQEKLEIILVDHHYLRSKLNEVVVEIIDHHQIKKNSIILQKYTKKNLCCFLKFLFFSN